MIDPDRAQVLTPTKDATAPYPIPLDWRPTIREIVRAFVDGDFALSRGVPRVRPVSAPKAQQMREYVADYGATLVALPEASWQTSECQWSHSVWDIMVDLWTAAEGRSDMILHARVFETDHGYEFDLHLVYVP